MTVVRVGMRFPARENERFTAQAAASLIGQPATLVSQIRGSEFRATGTVVAAHVVDNAVGPRPLRHRRGNDRGFVIKPATGTATFSSCGRYRYDLTRRWGDGPDALWIMCNPSTANAAADDPTIRRCISFSTREGAGGMVVLNLFALRSTDPDDLLKDRDPCGPDNLSTIRSYLPQASLIIVAWGTHKALLRSVIRLRLPEEADALGVKLACLGKTKGGQPKHPLYVAADAPLIPWP